jgi:hypothetical protein
MFVSINATAARRPAPCRRLAKGTGMGMNRFEALHALGLEEGATPEDVRLAYYGLEKAVQGGDYSGSERVQRQVDALLHRAEQARDFLLNPRNQRSSDQVRGYTSRRRDAVKVTRVEERTARLKGLEALRAHLAGYVGTHKHRRAMSIVFLLACVGVGFVFLRYLRAAPRYIAFTILGAAAIAGSTILTTSHLQVREGRGYVQELDERIEKLKRELGLLPEPDAGDTAPVSTN